MCSNWLQPMILFQQCRLTVDIRQTDGIWAHFEVLQQRINIQWGQSLLPWCHWYGSQDIQEYKRHTKWNKFFCLHWECNVSNCNSHKIHLNYCIIGLNRWPGGNFGQMCNSGQFQPIFQGQISHLCFKVTMWFHFNFHIIVMIGNGW